MLVPFTTADEVRALLGVDAIELTDETLDLPVYEQGLRRELYKVAPGLPALFTAALPPSAGTPDSRTPAQVRLHDAATYFAALTVAVQAGVSLPMRAPRRMTDDKSGFERFPSEPYTDVLNALRLQAADAKAALLVALSALTNTHPPSPPVPRHFVASRRSYDPVTGAGFRTA